MGTQPQTQPDGQPQAFPAAHVPVLTRIYCGGRAGRCRMRLGWVAFHRDEAFAITVIPKTAERPFDLLPDEHGRFVITCPRCNARPVIRKETLTRQVLESFGGPLRIS